MGFKVQILPYKIIIFDEEDEIDSTVIPDNIVRYCIEEGYCDAWSDNTNKIRVEILRIDK